MEYKPMTRRDCKRKLFRDFSRYQEVSRVWRSVDGEWVLRGESFVQQWDKRYLRQEAKKLRRQIKEGCFAYGAWDDGCFVGRACLGFRLFGSEGQYVQLIDLHITTKCRGRGTGKRLFELCCEKARKLGAQKLYISSFPAEETVRFYMSLGCVDARELDVELAKREPMDRHLELIL